MASRIQRGAQRCEEPVRTDNAVDDREVTAVRVPRRRRRDNAHHRHVLLMRLGLRRLDVSRIDDSEEPICFEMNGTLRLGGKQTRRRGLPSARWSGENENWV